MVRTAIEVSQNCNQGNSLLTDNLFILIKPFRLSYKFKINSMCEKFTILILTHSTHKEIS